MSAKANSLKEEGNKHFQDGDYKTAEMLYGKAIQQDSQNPKLFTNRAMTRLRLQSWEPCIDDCLRSIALDKTNNMKGYYYLAQAQLALHHPNEALNSAMTAYHECLKTNNSSTRNVSQLVLQAKKEKWEAKERERIRRRSALLAELEEELRRKMGMELRKVDIMCEGQEETSDAREEREEVEDTWRRKIEELRSVFAIADAGLQDREVPDYMIDNISFSVMHDPVMTKNGRSYERSTILEHLRRSSTDPLTRDPLTTADLRPNLALKQACAEFLEKNGWAVDY
ncbi:MAG: hypothetical protein L6R42_004110 [Xanthoria sp. 1 TBL-2021]|nr:MAG: hypothetical protein L6R42_004110 [Xanthoria sp. 1 TBL-2021]